ncbi:MAG: hypothetical protein ABEL76_10440 [Bradymonadaceae bacterium]
MSNWRTIALCAALAVIVGATAESCLGGANFNQQSVGDQPRGVKVGVGDIAVSKQGYLVFEADGRLAVAWPDDRRARPLPVEKPTRLAFADGRPVVYAHSAADGAVHAVDVRRREKLWSASIDVATASDENSTQLRRLHLVSSNDDSRVVTVWRDEMYIVETDGGNLIAHREFPEPVIDTKLTADSSRAIAVLDHTWQGENREKPRTRVEIVELEGGSTRTVTVPNCSDRITLDDNAAKAFLAPTRCNPPTGGAHDPISVVDLERGSESFVRNLPGFGPVEMAPRGHVAVGFVDAANVDPSLFDDRSQIPPAPDESADDGDGPGRVRESGEPGEGKPRYYLMVIDTSTLDYELHAYGDELPRYAMTPDGGVLLVDNFGGEDQRLQRFDTDTGEFRPFRGPPIMLNKFVMTGDSRRAYAIYSSDVDEPNSKNALYEVDIPGAQVSEMPLEFEPANINISPDDRRLYLRDARKNDRNEVLCAYSLAMERCTQIIQLGSAVQGKGPSG